MERVEGEPIDAWCDRRRMPVRGRLLLFLAVCDAVQHAHRRLVVHRDLKPSNILVGSDGAPKLLDFGIAKLLDPAAEGAAPTRLGELPMTPEYASPEQVRGEPVTTASDVYSLGLLLYELLTGRRAHRLSSYQRRDVERAVCEEPATRPSLAASRPGAAAGGTRDRPRTPEEIAEARRTTPKALRRHLAGDLDTIVLAALRKEPEQRYGSVEALADDLRRHLDDLPVRAQGDRLGYRAGKFVRRHRVSVTAAALAAVSLIAAAGASTWGLMRARTAEADAVAQAATAEEISTFLERLFAVSDPSEARGGSPSAREILDRGVERIDSELTDQPAVQARLLHTMARAYAGLGLIDEAGGMFERAYELRREHLGGSHAETLDSLGGLGNTLLQRGRLEEAESHLRRAYETARVAHGAEDFGTLKYLGNLALVVGRLGRFEEALELCRTTYELRRRTLGEDHLFTLLAATALGNALTDAGRLSEAVEHYERSLPRMRRLYGPDHPQTLHAINNLAIAYGDLGQTDKQERLLVEAVASATRIWGEEHLNSLTFRSNLALFHAMTGRHQEAEALAREVLASRRETLGSDHPMTLWSVHNLGTILRDAGRLEKGEEVLREALEARRRTLGSTHPQTLESMRELALLYRESERLDAAEALFREALAGWREQSDEHPSTVRAMNDLGELLAAQGRGEEAEALLAAGEAHPAGSR
jgi:serine/threonine-protein kinase